MALVVWHCFGQPQTHYIGIMTSNGQNPLPLYEESFDLFGIPFGCWLAPPPLYQLYGLP